MENPCYKCGQPVEEGVPFCPHCSAPQIRVVLATPPLSAAVAPARSGEQDSASQSIPAPALPAQRSQAVRSCAVAALIAAIAMVLKLVVPLIAVAGAGFLAVILHLRSNPGTAITAGAGARLGALCGLLCSGMTATLGALRVVILNEGEQIRRALLEGVQRTATLYPDPQFKPTLDFMKSSSGLVFMMFCMLFFMFLAFLLLGTLGGALGGVMLGRRGRT